VKRRRAAPRRTKKVVEDAPAVENDANVANVSDADPEVTTGE